MVDISEQLQAQVQQAYTERQCLNIQSANTKSFLGYKVQGQTLDIKKHQGIIDYQPTELTLKARAGTSLQEINELLAKHQQKMGFNPPQFSADSTLGGTVACKQSGPQAPFIGSVRDAILGIRILDGQGNILEFGGQVMKNVAGYDVSRFMSGSFGTLGILLDITFRLHPTPIKQVTLCRNMNSAEALKQLSDWIRQSVPISAACHVEQQLTIELTGTEKSLQQYSTLQDVVVLDQNIAQEFWPSVRDHQHPFFKTLTASQNLWRIIVPATTTPSTLLGEWFYDWAGSQRWFITEEPAEKIRAWTKQVSGYATLFRAGDSQSVVTTIFEPMPAALASLHQRIKSRFDPGLILNRGKMYPELDLESTKKIGNSKSR
ncbi:Glycolate dehydrogenase, FAD-binding subunit GlcE [hydrothermal vent metagenome]|uniref:Glycolate dehydrogenase, FAD-binding subunit GlcE n=1 Tax=hydrothermal vent metagenome TaxID=652676 RepID=A0A3B0ZA24_9ZZZZ